MPNPDRANVLAIIGAYAEAGIHLPYPQLVSIMQRLAATDSPLALETDRNVKRALHPIIVGLRLDGLVELGPLGTGLTPSGDEYVERWNGQFRERRQQAAQELRDLKFLAR